MKKTIIINGETLGKGSDELGEKLMGSFLRKLCILENKPDTIIFYNSGVKLLAKGSSVLDSMETLFKSGVDIMACGTCISYYKLNDKLAVGRVSNMQEITSIILNSENVITT